MKSQLKSASNERSAVLSMAVSEVAVRLGIGPTDTGDIVGLSQPTASRMLKGNYLLKEHSKEWELSAHLVRLYRALFSMVGGSDELASGWLRSSNKAFDSQKPIDLIKRVDGLLNVCEYLDAHRARI